ncbi:MAG: hypothetical protein C5S48_03925 [Candidatus Methanogaster sp.]|nr:MAG: hypothetical protein C5S48_03925 [ANME-2 cluster archaeon]
MARFLHELGMEPTIIATGTESKEFVADVEAVASQTGHEITIISGCDLYELHEAIKRVGVDLVMGNSQAKYIGDDEKIAFARIGFPVQDLGWLPAKSDHRVRRRNQPRGPDYERDSGSCGFGVNARHCSGWGMSILAVLCGECVRIFIKDLPGYSRKAYI